MATTKDDIKRWIEEAPEGTDYMIVACDTFDHSDYPVYVKTLKYWDKWDELQSANMTSIMESYCLHANIEFQLAEHRANHMPGRGGRW